MPINSELGSIGAIQGPSGNIARVYGPNGLIWERDAGPVTRAFMESDAGVMFSVATSGLVTLTIAQGTIESATFLNGSNAGVTDTQRTVSNDLVVRVPNDPMMWTNANETISFTVTAIQQARPVFDFSQAGVECSVDMAGNITLTSAVGQASIASGPTSYPLVTMDITRDINVRVVGVIPMTHRNSGQPFDVTGVCRAIQPEFVFPTFDINNDITVTCSVNGQTGVASLSVNTGSVQFASGQQSTFPTVTTPILRSIRVRVFGNVPNGFSNSGDPYSGELTCNTTQPAFQEPNFDESDWTGQVSVNPLGTVLIDRGNSPNVTTVPGSFDQNNTNDPIPRTFTSVRVQVPAGFPNTGQFISFSRTVQQPSNLPEFTVNDWTGTANVNQDGRISAGAGNAQPLVRFNGIDDAGQPTNRFPANNGTTPIPRIVEVTVTIPAGFRFFSQEITFRVATEQPFPMPEFDNNIFVSNQGALFFRVSPTFIRVTGQPSEVINRTITCIPHAGFTFNRNASTVSAETTNSTVAAPGTPFDDGLGLDTVIIPITSRIGSIDQSATVTVSGTSTRTAQFSYSPSSINFTSISTAGTSTAITANEAWELFSIFRQNDDFSGTNISVADLRNTYGVDINRTSGNGTANIILTRIASVTPPSNTRSITLFFTPAGATGTLPYSVTGRIDY